jgi:uncharacterized DUF497 family protein
MKIEDPYWRRDRIEHIARHEVSVAEVEEAVLEDRRGRIGESRPADRDPEETVCEYYGRTEAGRYLMVALLYMGQGLAMPLTAREMTRKERRNKYG